MITPRSRKQKPLPLHVSRSRIAAERINVVIRTNNKLASLAVLQHQIDAERLNVQLALLPQQIGIVARAQDTTNYHCCLNTFCFCLLLVLLNLLFMQWLYYKSLNLNVQ
jgi:hypothetical protein